MRGNHFIYLLLLFTIYANTSCYEMTNNANNDHNNEKSFVTFAAKELDINKTVISVAGQLPLILAVPHGSLNLPASIPNRTDGQLIADANTISVAKQLSNKIKQHYHAAPYLVIFDVARRKVDVNRPIDEGTESPQGRRVWKHYHNILQETVDTVKKRFGNGLLLDIHGQAHKEGFVELGYLLSADVLRSSSNNSINDSTLVHQSSIQLLASRLTASTAIETSALLRGNASFGYAMMKNSSHSVRVVPSPVHTYPEHGTLYFPGGYTTKQHHTTLDVIQVESPKSLRFSKAGRDHLTDSLTNAAIFMLDQYYLPHRSKL